MYLNILGDRCTIYTDKNKTNICQFFFFSLYGQLINDSKELPLLFLTVCAVNWNYAAANIITTFSAMHSLH